MPWNDNSDDHIITFVLVLGCLQSVIDRHVGCQFVFGGKFCTSKNTYHSDVNDRYSLIDHFICTPQ